MKIIIGAIICLLIYQNGKYGLVEDSELDKLIVRRKIKKFLRSTGWSTLGADPTRKDSRIDSKGQERRQIELTGKGMSYGNFPQSLMGQTKKHAGTFV